MLIARPWSRGRFDGTTPDILRLRNCDYLAYDAWNSENSQITGNQCGCIVAEEAP